MTEQTAIQTVGDDNAIAPTTPQQPSDPMFNLLERIALEPNLPVERLTFVMDMQERQLKKIAEQEFNRAFAAAMSKMPPAKKSGLNKHTEQKYSTLADLVDAARPALSDHGLALNWNTSLSERMLTVTAIVRHEGGWKEETSMSAPLDAGKGQGASMNLIQSYGSTETYLKRYTGFAILGMSSEDFDDDGNGVDANNQTVSADQYIILRDLMEETNTDEAKFHTAFGHNDPDNADLHQFPANKFQHAKEMLERKKSQMEAA